MKFRGLSTVNFYASDLKEAKKWYSEVFGLEPYFNAPGYAEFRLGDYMHEFGIIDSKYAPKKAIKGAGGAIVYWHVDDLQETLDFLISKGAKIYEPIIDRSNGKMAFVTASVMDPFGNILGIMHNSHYIETLASSKSEKN